MRLGVALLIAALPAATAVAAVPDTGAFHRFCRARGPIVSCNCIAAELLRTRRGQIAIEGMRLREMRQRGLPLEQIQPYIVEFTRRYDASVPELTEAMNAAKSDVLAAGRKCR
jgi:hypothetical protein